MINLIKDSLNVVISRRLWLLRFLLVVQVVFLGYLFYSSIHDERYFLAHEDEVINFCSAKVFSMAHSVRAEGCIAEEVSRWGQMNWYGPGYAVLFGSLQRLFGDGPTLFIQLNGFFAVMTLVMIFLLPVSNENKLLIGNALVYTQVYTLYIFSYFPESFHLLLSMAMIMLLVLPYSTGNKKLQNAYIVTFVVLVVAMILIRVTYVFWLIALIGLAETKRKMMVRITLFLVILAFTLVYMKFFTAPPYAAEMQKIGWLYEFNLIEFLLDTIQALIRNTFQLLTTGSVSVYILLLILGFACFQWWKSRNRFLLAAVLTSCILLAALMSYYSAGPWYFLKQSSGLMPLLLVAVILSPASTKTKYGIVLISILGFFATLQQLKMSIADHRLGYERLEEYRDFHVALQEFTSLIKENRPVTVLWCYDEYPFGVCAEALLPFATDDHQPILYTTNVLSANSPPEIKFQLHHKLKVDYLLSEQSIELPFVKELHATPYYHFYKVIGE